MAKYKFEQIAINSTEKKKPVEQDRFAYIGLEHMDPGCLNVTRFGTEVAPVGEKLIMHKGDVLFGKRRAYQKKVAIAPFDGIFSAHGMVLRPREDIIDRRFFPLFISSDYFLDAAIKISVGSLSPTINWRDLKELEFELPDLDRQRKLAEVLWAINDAVESYKKLLDATDKLVKARFGEIFGDLENSQYRCTVHEAVRKGIIEKPLDGNHGEKHPKASEYVSVGIPFIMANDIDRNGNVAFERCNYITKERALKLDKGFAKDGDVLITHKGTIGRTAVLHTEKEFVMLTPQVTYYRCVKDILAEYLKGYFDSTYFQSVMQNIAGIGTTRAYIGITAQEKLPLVIPPMELQEQFAAFVHQTDKSKSELEQALSELTATYKRILSENLG